MNSDRLCWTATTNTHLSTFVVRIYHSFSNSDTLRTYLFRLLAILYTLYCCYAKCIVIGRRFSMHGWKTSFYLSSVQSFYIIREKNSSCKYKSRLGSWLFLVVHVVTIYSNDIGTFYRCYRPLFLPLHSKQYQFKTHTHTHRAICNPYTENTWLDLVLWLSFDFPCRRWFWLWFVDEITLRIWYAFLGYVLKTHV